MQLYAEFNDTVAMMYEHYPDIFSRKDIADLKRAETSRKKQLVEEYLERKANGNSSV